MTRVPTLLMAAAPLLAACTPGAGQTAEVKAPETSGPSNPTTAGSTLGLGPAPQIPYVQHGRYLTPSGDSLVLPQAGRRGVSGVVRYADGLLVSDALWFEGSNGIAFVRRGVQVASWPSSHEAGHRCQRGDPVAR